MLYSWRSGYLPCLALLVALGFLSVACGGGECSVNGDCIQKNGPGYVCTAAGGTKTCTKSKPKCPSTCNNDSDCGACTGGRTACVIGGCAVPPSQCPGACTSDAQCANCTGGNTSCVGGVCGKAAPTCPSTCTVDADCKDCAGGNNFCKTGTCSSNTTEQCPSSCTGDADCAKCPDSKTSCENSVCVKKSTPPQCPASCTGNLDCASCPDGKTTCENSVCVKKTAPPTCPNKCTTNADCAPCAPGKQTCTNGICDTAQPPQCPASCSGDGDCAKCPDSRTSCVNGACAKKTNPPQCPATCNANTDCANCPDGRLVCAGGQCAKPTNPQCPNSCSTDNDCSGCPSGKQACVGGVCGSKPACPSSCTGNGDCASCPNGETSCVSGKCAKPTTPQCPASCQADTDCNPCGSGFTCQQNKCAKGSSNPNVGASCSQQQQCAAGFTCLLVTQNNAVCFQDCSTSATANVCASNTDGRTSCIQVATDSSTNQPIKICLAVVNKGQKCGFQGALQAQCKTGENPPLYCSVSKGVCDAAIIQKKAGDVCNKQNDNTEPIRICDNASKLVCDQNTGKCTTASIAQEGEECDTTGAALGKAVICDPSKKDLTCIRYDQAGQLNRCQYLCNPQGTSQCSHKAGLTCAALLSNGGGLCMDLTCTTDADCAWSGYVCTTQSGGGNICFPPNPVGPKKFAEICSTPTRTKGCVKDLFCLSLQGASSGWCSKDCTTAGTTCPSAGTTKSVCTTIPGSTQKTCLFPCGGAGQTCPTGLTCQTAGSLQTCLAP